MNTRNIAAEHRLAHWSQIMRDRAEKGLSIRAYCESAGIHENTYFYWQHKLREAACLGTQMATIESEKKSLVSKGWATLSVSVSEKSAQPEGLTIEVGGCRITVCAETNPELLAKVCRTLKAL
jgi:putative transposase